MTLPHLHAPIEALLRGPGGLPAEVEVACAVPSAEWRGELLAPTLCLYMFDMAENAELRNASAQTARANGAATTRLAPRRVDLRYLVCAFAGDAEDEQAIVWRALAVLLAHPTLPPELLPPEVRELGVAVQTKVGPYQDAPRLLELWGALELPPRPALLYTVTAPLDLRQEVRAPLVLSRTLRSAPALPGDGRAGRRPRPAEVTGRVGYEPFGGRGTAEDGAREGAPAFRERAVYGLDGVACAPGGVARAGVPVRVAGWPAGALTDAAGRFALGPLRPGPAMISLPCHGRSGEQVRALRIDAEPPWAFDLVLLDAVAGVARGRDGAPVAGVTVGAPDRDLACVTDGEGRFLLAGFPPGPATIAVAPPGRPARSLEVVVPWAFDLLLLDVPAVESAEEE